MPKLCLKGAVAISHHLRQNFTTSSHSMRTLHSWIKTRPSSDSEAAPMYKQSDWKVIFKWENWPRFQTWRTGPSCMQIAWVVNCTCCKFYMMQIACVASCTCCKLHVLQIAVITNCMYCKLHVLLFAPGIQCINTISPYMCATRRFVELQRE